MVQFAYGLVGLAVAGAIASWVAGATFYVQALRAIGGASGRRGSLLYAAFAWPSALGKLRGTPGTPATTVNATKVNKAFVAFLGCSIVAFAAISAATNLARIYR